MIQSLFDSSETKLQQTRINLYPGEPFTVTANVDNSELKLAAGFEICEVISASQSRWVIWDNIPSSIASGKIRGILQDFGDICSLDRFEKPNKSALARAQFRSFDSAMGAAAALDGEILFGRRATVRLPLHRSGDGLGVWEDANVCLEWVPPTITAFSGYPADVPAKRAAEAAHGVNIRGFVLSAALYEGVPSLDTYTVRIGGLPPNVTQKDLTTFGNPGSVMFQDTKCVSLDRSMAGIRNILTAIGDVIFSKPRLSTCFGGLVRVWAKFDVGRHADQACLALHNRSFGFIGQRRMNARRFRSVVYTLPSSTYNQIENDLLRLVPERRGHQTTYISVSGSLGRSNCAIVINLLGERMEDVRRLKVSFEDFLGDNQAKVPSRIGISGPPPRNYVLYFPDEVVQEMASTARKQSIAQISQYHCSICLGVATAPISLDCGHSWCRSCLHRHFDSSADLRIFPVLCHGNEGACRKPISLLASCELLSSHRFDALVRTSFSAHIQFNDKDFFVCPTTDCPQAHRKISSNYVAQCPNCLVHICPQCRQAYHDNVGCMADDETFQDWAELNLAKNCPACNAPIQRGEGCNHITCFWCRTHFCWECLKTFPRGEGIYDHMRTEHGGIYR